MSRAGACDDPSGDMGHPTRPAVGFCDQDEFPEVGSPALSLVPVIPEAELF